MPSNLMPMIPYKEEIKDRKISGEVGNVQWEATESQVQISGLLSDFNRRNIGDTCYRYFQLGERRRP